MQREIRVWQEVLSNWSLTSLWSFKLCHMRILSPGAFVSHLRPGTLTGSAWCLHGAQPRAGIQQTSRKQVMVNIESSHGFL